MTAQCHNFTTSLSQALINGKQCLGSHASNFQLSLLFYPVTVGMGRPTMACLQKLAYFIPRATGFNKYLVSCSD